MSSTTPKLRIQSTSPVGADGIVRCNHGEQADRLISRTAKNPGREFYTCSRPHSDRCSFWYWVDDPIFAKRPSQSVSVNGLCTPRASPFHSTTSAIPSTPGKRKRPDGFVTDPSAIQTSATPASNFASADTPSKKARLEAIEAGLRARLEGGSPRQPLHPQPTVPEQSDTLPFTHGVGSTSAPSPETTDVEEEVEPPRARYSFLGLPPTQESESGAGTSAPKKRLSFAVAEQQGLNGHHGGSSPSSLLTPPQTSKLHTNRVETFNPTASGSGSSRPEPTTPTRYKGKERASPQWDRLVAAEENPFVNTTSSFKSKLEADAHQRASRSRRSSLDSDSQGPSCTPTIGERVTANITRMRDMIHVLGTYADNFDQLDAVKHIERLERQRNALVFGDEAQKKHIATLSAECDALKEELRRVKERCRVKDETIASLRAQR